MTDRAALDAFKAGLSITQVAERLGLRPVRGRLRCLQPERHAHGDRTPSLSLYEERGTFHCFVCEDVRGDSIELVRRVKGCGFREALDFLGAPTGLLQPGPMLSPPSRRNAIPSSPPIPHQESRRLPTQMNGERRIELLRGFLRLLSKIEEKSAPAYYLAGRKIFAPVWAAAKLRWIEDFIGTERKLLEVFPLADLQAVGLVGESGRLRFQNHPLILPYLDQAGNPVHFQARALDKGVVPKELTLKGSIPVPFNAPILDGRPGIVYLCEGAVDTLTVLGAGRHAVGIPGAGNFKAEWAPLFKGKRVLIAFDNDGPGRAGAERACAALLAAEVYAEILIGVLGAGQDVNDWFRS